MLAGRCGACCGIDFSLNAQPGEYPERHAFRAVEFADGFHQSEHTLLNYILRIRAREKIGTRAGLYQTGIPFDQILRCGTAGLLRQTAQSLIGHLRRREY